MTQSPRRTTASAEVHYSQLDNAAAMDASMAERRSAFDLDLARLERLTAGRRLLDVGCASGEFLRAARDRGWDVWGVEPTEACAAFARDRLGLRVRTGVLSASDWDAQRFDAVTLSFVLEHIPDPLGVIREALAALAPGGVLFLMVPNCGALAVRLRLILGRFRGSREADAGHAFYFTRETLGGFVAKGGGRVLRVRDGIGGGLVVRRLPPALARPSLPLLAALDSLDWMTSVPRLGTTLRVWAARAS
jgi:2-polyprenyl-3-methyl-5-hydroxy-6-metoxy-1,4-benzoquinol methylase